MTGKKSESSSERVEPLFEALVDPEEEGGGPASGPVRPRLAWKLLWAALVLLGLVAIVLNQAF